MLIPFIVFQIAFLFGAIFFLRKIFYGDTQSALNRLDTVYQDLLAKQKDLTQKIETAEKEYAQKKEEAAKIADKMTMQAMDEVRQKKDDILKAAKAEAEEIVTKAHASSDKFYREIEKKVMSKMVESAADLLKNSLSEETLTVLHRQLLKEFLDRGKEFDLSNVDPTLKSMTVKTAFVLSDQDKTQIKAFLTDKLKRSIEIEEAVEQTLSAGVLLQFGTLMLDGSLANYIREHSLQTKKKIEGEA